MLFIVLYRISECTACRRRTPDIDLHIGQHRVCLIAER
jgi:hypothetical protein